MQTELSLRQLTHRRSLQLSQLLILQHLQTFKAKHKQVNQASRLVTQVYQWMMMYQQPLKMAQQLKLFQVKELTLLLQMEL